MAQIAVLLLNFAAVKMRDISPCNNCRNSPIAAGAQGLGWLSVAIFVSQASTPVRLPGAGKSSASRQ